MVNRILLADDSITIQKVVNLTFADEGIEVVSVSNGDQAERRLNEVNPDLVLADIFMPGKNGYELCEAIKENPQFQNVPVVLLVGAFEPFDQAEARRVRADAHLTKPFESRTLVETVRKLINSSTQQNAAASSSSAPTGDQDARPGGLRSLDEARSLDETRSPNSIATQGFRPDFSAFSNQDAPGEDDALLPGLDQSQSDQAENLQPLGVQFDSESYQTEPYFSASPTWANRVEADSPAEGASQADPLDLTPFEIDSSPQVKADTTSGAESGLQDAKSSLASGFGDESQGMILDIDAPEVTLPYRDDSSFAFDFAANSPASVSKSGFEGEGSSDWSRSESDVFKTQMLEPPPGHLQAREAVDTNPLEMPASTDFHRPSVAPQGFTEMEEDSSSSTLLAVDDPLGDVLMDDRELSDFSYEPRQAPQMFFVDQAAEEEIDLEFIPQEQEALNAPSQSRVTGELSAPASYNLEEVRASDAVMEQVSDPHRAGETILANVELVGSNEPVESARGAEPVASNESVAGSRWAESGFELKTDVQPEREFEQVDQAVELSTEAPAEVKAIEADSGFTASAMWTEQDTRFAPIDIEATPVDEPAEARGAADSAKVETGFEFAPAVEAPVSPEADARVTEEKSGAETSKPATASESVEASSALVDEVVRRVVAQLSESVVREIAWEVVPDVVERVIKEIAREEVSKRA
jgi:CheY-like chemotaxis protein